MDRNMNETAINRTHFAAMVEVAAEYFGEDDPTTKALRASLDSPHSDAIERGIALIRALPTAHRDHIFCHASLKLSEKAKQLSWLMKKAGVPTHIPPGETMH